MARKPKDQSNETPATDVTGVALDTDRRLDPLPDDEDAAKASYGRHREAVKEPVRYADPFGLHSVRWEDGFKIQIQESRSRGTIELQFGNGTRESQPQAFNEIKAILKEEGFRWNGSNAWAKELRPVVGSQNDRLRSQDENRRIRGRVEDLVFPQIIALEEAQRGEIDLAETTRDRINKAVSAQSR